MNTTETGNRQGTRPGGSNQGCAGRYKTEALQVYHTPRLLSNGNLPEPVADLVAQAQRRIRRNEGGAALAAFSLARCVAEGDEVGTYRAAHTLARYMTQVDKHRAVERSLRKLAGRKGGAHGQS